MEKESNSKWTLDSAKEYAYHFKSRGELKKASYSCYDLLRVNNLLDEIYEKKGVIKITTEDCVDKANGCLTWCDFTHRYKRHTKYCVDNGIVDLIKEHIRKNSLRYQPLRIRMKGSLQKRICLEKAKLCKTKVEFRTMHKREYVIASANKWLKEYTWLSGCKGRKYGNKSAVIDEGITAAEKNIEKAIKVAKQCVTKHEFRVGHPTEYRLASKHRLLKGFTWLKGCKKAD